MPEGSAERILLDTHTWIWLVAGDARVARSAGVIRKAISNRSAYVSVMSVWEIGMLDVKGRITLSVPCESWVEAAIGRAGLELVELTPAIALASTRLPGDLHGDPVDRMLAATARALNATLVTSDRRLLDYAGTGQLRARAA